MEVKSSSTATAVEANVSGGEVTRLVNGNIQQIGSYTVNRTSLAITFVSSWYVDSFVIDDEETPADDDEDEEENEG